ncbi:glycosyltransferase [Microbacterium sp. F51-2R]|uniref:glycosyltransferase n=1 Tax=Microbacterium sp. F51-2R TaxID=3445777 RepID=UPI003F9F84A7
MTGNTSAAPGSIPTGNRIWARSTSVLLLLVGLVLAIAAFAVVVSMPELRWSDARDAELRATYDAYRDTGTLLVKEAGTGAKALSDDSGSPIVSAAWDDPPGAYVTASLMSHLTQSTSPYPGLAIAQALLIAIPLIWLPTATARIFRRARAGYALILLPPLTWLLNNGTILLGTEYGLADEVTTLRVYALYGLTASLSFLVLSLLLFTSTYRLSQRRLIVTSVLLALLAGVLATFNVLAGIGAAIAIGVLWMRAPRGRRVVRAVVAAAVAVLIALAAQSAISGLLDLGRSDATGQSIGELPRAHTFWQDLYLGLSYPEPVNGSPSRFDVTDSEAFALEQAQSVDPEIEAGTVRYDEIMRDLYWGTVGTDPWGAVNLYFQKLFYVVKHYGAMIGFILVGFIVAGTRRVPQQRPLAAALAIAVPTLLLGFTAPVLLMPFLYSYALLSPALGLLAAVSLGALVWSITSMPSHFRSVERTRLSSRSERHFSNFLRRSQDSRVRLSVVVPTRNGADVLDETLATLGDELSANDEIIVVENGSTDGTTELLGRIRESWAHAPNLIVTHSEPGLGEALRTGVLTSHGRRMLLTADDLPFGFTDLEEFRKLPDDVAVAVGSKAHPDSQVARSRRRTVQSRIFRFLREALLQSQVGDSQGTLWVDGDWGREFAHLSRESGLMWTTELVLAAEQQGIVVREVPVALSQTHEKGSSRFRLKDAWQSFVGFTRLAVYKDDYFNEDWVRSTRPTEVEVVDSL